MPGTLSAEQIAQLLKPIPAGRVKRTREQSHVEGYDIRAHLNRIFGFGNWELLGSPATLIYEDSLDTGKKKGNGWPIIRWTVVYRVCLTLVIYDPYGERVASYRGEAVGSAENQPSRADADDLAIKEAETQALKRAATNLGDQFGLGLYNKNAEYRDKKGKQAFYPCVKRTLVNMPTAPASPDVAEGAPDVDTGEDEAEEVIEKMAGALPKQAAEKAAERDARRTISNVQLAELNEARKLLSSDQRSAIGRWCTDKGISAGPTAAARLTVGEWEALMAEIRPRIAGKITPTSLIERVRKLDADHPSLDLSSAIRDEVIRHGQGEIPEDVTWQQAIGCLAADDIPWLVAIVTEAEEIAADMAIEEQPDV